MAKILVIDDDKDVRKALELVLSRAGHDVVLADRGEPGLERLREDGADLVITDIIMPGIDGVAVVNSIRAEFPGVPVVVISGGGNVEPEKFDPGAIATTAYLASATRAGADRTLTKPFERQELVEAVETLLAAD